MKQNWYGSIYKEMELDMNCLTSRILFAESLQQQMSVLHQESMCKAGLKAGLSSQVHMMMAGQNVKKKNTWCVRSQSKCWNNMEFQTGCRKKGSKKGAEKLASQR